MANARPWEFTGFEGAAANNIGYEDISLVVVAPK